MAISSGIKQGVPLASLQLDQVAGTTPVKKFDARLTYRSLLMLKELHDGKEPVSMLSSRPKTDKCCNGILRCITEQVDVCTVR